MPGTGDEPARQSRCKLLTCPPGLAPATYRVCRPGGMCLGRSCRGRSPAGPTWAGLSCPGASEPFLNPITVLVFLMGVMSDSSSNRSSAVGPLPLSGLEQQPPSDQADLRLLGSQLLPILERLTTATEQVACSLGRLAEHFAPAPAPLVNTPYVAKCLGCTVTWVSEMVRNGEIPRTCIVPGTGNGKPWKFFRDKIDRWIESR